jgi:AcrR family transcriptional regulator
MATAMKSPPGKKGVGGGAETAVGRQRTARYDAKLTAVLSASSALFAAKGYERTTVRDVAQATGMSLAGLYHYFKSKEELLFLIQFRVFQSLCGKLREIIGKETDSQACLRRMIRMHLDYFIRHMNDLKVCSREIESLEGDFYQKVADKRKEYFDLTQSIFEMISNASGGSSADSRLAALYLFGTLNWIYQWYRPGRDPDAEEMASQLAGVYLNGFPRMAEQYDDQKSQKRVSAVNKRGLS